MNTLKNIILSFALLCALTVPSLAQSASDNTITGTIYDGFNNELVGFSFTVTVTRRDGVPISTAPKTVTTIAAGALPSTFQLPRKSFVTFRGNFTIGRYNFANGLSMFIPDEATTSIYSLQSVEDAAASLVAVSAAPSDAQYVVGTSNASLSAEQSLGALTTGILKNTVSGSTGTLSTAVAADLPLISTLTADAAPDSAADYVMTYDASAGVHKKVLLSNLPSGGGGAGTVTSVAQSFTGGLISVAGSPITSSGTLALTVAGTSGGIPYFSSSTGWASSAALAANAIVIGGGAGTAPSTTTTGTGVLTALGVNVGSAGAFVTFNGAGGTPSSLTGTNITGTAAGLTAGAATVLATARTINGTSFDGSANITVTAAAGTLTGATLNSGVTASSLTSFGASPTIAGGSITGLTSFGIRSTGTGAFDLTLANSENLTAGRTLTIATGDAARTLTLGGNATLNGGTHSGTNTGDQTTVSGNAGTATALQTARTIGGVSFDGTANITVASATGGFAVTTELTTPSTTFALANTTATTVNAFGAATTINLGTSASVLNFGGGATAAELRFLEPSGSGTSYSAFKAVAQGANITYSLPATVGAAGTVLTDAAGNGVLSWAAGGGGITVGTTTVTSGTDTRVLFNNAGVVGQYAITGTTNVVMSASPTLTGTVGMAAMTASGTITQTSASATAFESGPNGGTNPVLRIVNSTASQADGISITGGAAGAGTTITALSSGSNSPIIITPKGTGVTLSKSPFISSASSTTSVTQISAGNALGAKIGVYDDGSGAYALGIQANQFQFIIPSSTPNFSFGTGTSASLTELLRISGGGNLGLRATSFGTSAVGVFAVGNGTAPTSSVTDTSQLYGADINGTAGSAGFHIRNEINTAALILPGVRYKTDTGDPTDTYEGMMVINTFDNTFKVFAEGAWRTVTTW